MRTSVSGLCDSADKVLSTESGICLIKTSYCRSYRFLVFCFTAEQKSNIKGKKTKYVR